MKRLMMCAIFIVTALVSMAQENVEYTDQATKVRLSFPAGSKIEYKSGFHHADVVLGKSFCRIYSMINQNGETFSWNEINAFDNANRYGKILKSKRIKNKDGWMRLYRSEGKSRHFTYVTLVRGKKYAFYMTETALDENNLMTESIVKSAYFPSSSARVVKKITIVDYVVFLFMLFFPLLFFPLLKKLSIQWFITVAMITLLAVCLYLWFAFGANVVATISLGVVVVCEYYIVYQCDSWGNAIEKVLSKMDG